MADKILMTGVGSYLPERVVTNHDLAKWVDTSHDWIVQRTGIEQRHMVADGEKTSDLAVAAAEKAMAHAGVDASQLDLIVIATTTPDDTFPSTATTVQRKLNASHAFAFDVQAVCAGFVYALTVAESMMKAQKAKKALVIGAESFTKLLDWEDRGTCVLFGDGAGAVILESHDTEDDYGILASSLHSDGNYRDILYVDGGPSATGDVGHVRMEGREVFRHAVEKLSSVMDEVIQEAGLSAEDVDWLVPHQANLRIINGMQKKLNLPEDRVVRTVHKHANTSAASIPLALSEAVHDGRIKAGDLLALEAIGGGLAWGASLVRFGRP